MTKQEFFDKIDNVRLMTHHILMTEDNGEEWHDEAANVIKTLVELRTDAELLLEEEYDMGYELGLNRNENLAG